MKKLYTLKTWFSLPDAADRLSASLKEDVTVKDILQLAIDGALPISCYVRDLPARRYPPEINNLTNNNNKLNRTKNTEESLAMATSEQDTLGCKVTDFLTGPYKIKLDNCVAIKDWLYGLITDSDSEIAFRDGFFLSDEEGNTWQVLEYADYLVLTTPKGEKVVLGPQYLPCNTFPNRPDLIVQRQHIELFEEFLLKSNNDKTTHPRTKTSYLNIIAVLLDVISNGIPNSEIPGSKLGPIPGFKSEANLIASIVKHYDGYSGLSKNNIEKKFSGAKRNLNTSS